MKQAIFNADDFGFSEKVNKGIVEAVKKGVVRDSSLITTMPTTTHAIKLIRLHKLNVGAHLSLTDGKPLSKEKNNSIINKGCFLSIKDLIIKILLKKVKKEDIKKEFRAQIEKLFENKIKPSHLDTHKYIHMFSVIFRCMGELASEYKIKKIRISDEKISTILCNLPKENIFSMFRSSVLKSVFVSELSSITKKNLAKYDLVTTDNFYGIARINSKNVLASFENIIKNIPDGTSEIMCHPGYYDKGIEKFSFYAKQREDELKALTSSGIKELIKKYKIRLISFKNL